MLPTEENLIQFPLGLYSDDCIGLGGTGAVARLDAVVKTPSRQQVAPEELARERQVYESLAPAHHSGILRYFGHLHDGSIVLEFARHDTIRRYIRKSKNCIDMSLRLSWIPQIAKTIAFIHTKGIIHADISASNIFLDEKLFPKIGDFAGSSIDGKKAFGCYEYGYSHPRDQDKATVSSEIFALGSTFYEIMVGKRPYPDMEPHEVDNAFQEERYPDLSSLTAYGDIIQRCWTEHYKTVDQVLVDITLEEDRLKAPVSIPGPRQSRYAMFSLAAAVAGIAVWWRLRR